MEMPSSENALALKKDCTAHPKMAILSPFTHHYVVSILYGFLSSAEHSEDILRNVFGWTIPNGARGKPYTSSLKAAGRSVIKIV